MAQPHPSLYPTLLLASLLAVSLLAACGGDKAPAASRDASGPLQVRVQVLTPHPLENIIQTTGSLLANASNSL